MSSQKLQEKKKECEKDSNMVWNEKSKKCVKISGKQGKKIFYNLNQSDWNANLKKRGSIMKKKLLLLTKKKEAVTEESKNKLVAERLKEITFPNNIPKCFDVFQEQVEIDCDELTEKLQNSVLTTPKSFYFPTKVSKDDQLDMYLEQVEKIQKVILKKCNISAWKEFEPQKLSYLFAVCYTLALVFAENVQLKAFLKENFEYFVIDSDFVSFYLDKHEYIKTIDKKRNATFEDKSLQRIYQTIVNLLVEALDLLDLPPLSAEYLDIHSIPNMQFKQVSPPKITFLRKRAEKMTPELCNAKPERVWNEQTKKCVKRSGTIGKKILKGSIEQQKEKCNANPETVWNDKTKKCVKRSGEIGSKITKGSIEEQKQQCNANPETVWNDNTKKCVKRSGAIGKKILKNLNSSSASPRKAKNMRDLQFDKEQCNKKDTTVWNDADLTCVDRFSKHGKNILLSKGIVWPPLPPGSPPRAVLNKKRNVAEEKANCESSNYLVWNASTLKCVMKNSQVGKRILQSQGAQYFLPFLKEFCLNVLQEYLLPLNKNLAKKIVKILQEIDLSNLMPNKSQDDLSQNISKLFYTDVVKDLQKSLPKMPDFDFINTMLLASVTFVLFTLRINDIKQLLSKKERKTMIDSLIIVPSVEERISQLSDQTIFTINNILKNIETA